MKKVSPYKLGVFALLLLSFGFVSELNAQSKVDQLNHKYYVVVGAYATSKEHYASKFTDKLNAEGASAVYTKIPGRSLFFVVLISSNDFSEALTAMYMQRKSGAHPKCWVYRNKAYDANLANVEPERPAKEVQEPKENKPAKEEEEIEVDIDVDITEEVVARDPEPVVSEAVILEEIRVGSKRGSTKPSKVFYFNVFKEVTGDPLEGDISIIDPNRVSLIKKVKGNKAYALSHYNSDPSVVFTCETFGFRKLQHEVNFDAPFKDKEAPYIVGVNDTIVVNFEMIRYKKGDLFTLFHVYFYKDSEVMKSESKYELQQLQEMLENNSKYKIKIHGHTNGNAHGKIIYRESDSSYFKLGNNNKTGQGSAKKLSETRAVTLKKYLIDNGIAEDRIETMAWGGKKMIYDKNSEQAKKNVRVEIEILED